MVRGHCSGYAGKSVGLGNLSGTDSPRSRHGAALRLDRRVGQRPAELGCGRRILSLKGLASVLCVAVDCCHRRGRGIASASTGGSNPAGGAAYQGVRHIRHGGADGVCSGGGRRVNSVFGDAPIRSRIRNARIRSILATSAVAMFAVLAFARSADLATIHQSSRSTFGAGLSWWFPERAAEFIERENIPGEIFNTYIEGGYVAWRLGPKHRDYIDGRAIPFGPQAFLHQAELLQSSPDSDAVATGSRSLQHQHHPSAARSLSKHAGDAQELLRQHQLAASLSGRDRRGACAP